MARIGLLIDDEQLYHSKRKRERVYHVGRRREPCPDGQQIKGKHLAAGRGPKRLDPCEACKPPAD